MAEGIRIRHIQRRNTVHVVPLLHKPFPPDAQLTICGACERGSGQQLKHPVKTLHLALDDTGSIIVSKDILNDLRRCPDTAGYRVDSAVLNPPPVGIAPARINVKIHGITFGDMDVTADEYVDARARNGATVDQAINELAVMLIQQMLGQETGGIVHANRIGES